MKTIRWLIFFDKLANKEDNSGNNESNDENTEAPDNTDNDDGNEDDSNNSDNADTGGNNNSTHPNDDSKPNDRPDDNKNMIAVLTIAEGKTFADFYSLDVIQNYSTIVFLLEGKDVFNDFVSYSNIRMVSSDRKTNVMIYCSKADNYSWFEIM